MDVSDTDLPGVRLFEPDVYDDDRGAFMEIWNAREYGHCGLTVTFVQDNLSRSREGVPLRHVQLTRVLRREDRSAPLPERVRLGPHVHDDVVDRPAQYRN